MYSVSCTDTVSVTGTYLYGLSVQLATHGLPPPALRRNQNWGKGYELSSKNAAFFAFIEYSVSGSLNTLFD